MLTPARVTSLDMLRDFRAALAGFRIEGQDALTAVELDLRRAGDWLAERRQFWQRQVRALQDELTQAKAELSRRQMVLPGERPPDCTQQIKALRKAQQMLEHAEGQVERCRRWEPALRRAVEEYEGPARQLGGLLDADLPRAVALLERLLTSLEAYVAVAPTSVPPSPPEGRGERRSAGPRPEPAMTLTTGRTKLLESYKALLARWEDTREGWGDLVGKEFEEKCWEPIGPHVQATLRAIDRLAAVIAQMHHECE